MIKFYLLLFSFAFHLFSTAQTLQLNVIVKQEKEGKGQNSTIQLIKLPDSIVISTKAIQSGFSFSVFSNTSYLVKVTAVGMQEKLQQVNIQDSSITLTIDLKNKISNLGNVTVTSRKPLIKQEDDKTIIDAEVLAQSSTNAFEVMEKIPGAVVDQDGNVYLNSATPATIQINGREVKLSTADLASLLKSLPANSVLKIEVLRSPSAKFDASGSGGIVNIVLKKGVKIGSNGSANVGYFQGRYSSVTAGFNLNKSAKKLNSYVSYQFTKRKNFETLSSLRFISKDTSVIDQDSYTTYPSLNNYISAGVDYAVNEKFTIGYDARASFNNNTSKAANDINIYNTYTGIYDDKNQSLIDNRSSSFYLGNNISSKYKIDSVGSEWTTSIDYNYFNSNNNQVYRNLFFFPVSPMLSGDGDINNRKNIFTAQTDFVFKLKSKYTIETGGKFNVSNSRNNSDYFIGSNGNRQQDITQTNKFRYKETISSAYLQVAKTFFGLTVKPGLRMETTNIYGRQLFPTDTTLSIRRTDFFPYVYLRHTLFKMMGFSLTGNLIYRRSISRPYYEVLNPYPKYIDPYLRDIGNPKLRPQFTTNYEFNVMADDIPVISVGINDTKDIFTNVTYQDDVTKIAYRTYDNLGQNKETYYRVLGGIPPGGKYFFYVGAQYNRVHYKGAYQNKPFEYKRGSWLFFMYQNYKPNPNLNLSLNGFMRLKGLQNFYEIKTLGGLTLSVNQSVLKKKANIIISVNDIFQTNRYNFSIEQAGIKAEGTRYNDTRKIGLTFRYNFGIKPKEENKGGFEQPAEVAN
ncbi:MAG: outer membrane beta-barrel protein [Ferruginibacter sp.]